MRGPQKVVTWTPAGFPDASSDTRLRLLDLYTHTDPGLAQLLEDALALEGMAGGGSEMAAVMGEIGQADLSNASRRFSEMARPPAGCWPSPTARASQRSAIPDGTPTAARA
jgi:uncharacterized protein (DUF1501 family)